MPLLIPKATVLPACRLDASPAEQTLHCANVNAGRISIINKTAIFFVSFILQIYVFRLRLRLRLRRVNLNLNLGLNLKSIIRRYHQVDYHPGDGYIKPNRKCPPGELAVFNNLVSKPIIKRQKHHWQHNSRKCNVRCQYS